MKASVALYARPVIVRGEQCAKAPVGCRAAPTSRRALRWLGATLAGVLTAICDGGRSAADGPPEPRPGRPAVSRVAVAAKDVRTPPPCRSLSCPRLCPPCGEP